MRARLYANLRDIFRAAKLIATGFFGDRLLGGLLFTLGAPPFCSHWQV
jgi:hypothetical protein